MTEHRTKARTRGQVRRSKGGRPRKIDAAREPSGSICKAAREPVGPAVLQETLMQRAVHFGLDITDVCGEPTAIGALWWKGRYGHVDGIGKDRRMILDEYRALWVNWSAMSGSRRFRPEMKPTGGELSLESWRYADDRMAACDATIRRRPFAVLALSLLETICLDDIAPPALRGYREGVNAVADRVYVTLNGTIDAIGDVMHRRKVPERPRPGFEEKRSLFEARAKRG